MQARGPLGKRRIAAGFEKRFCLMDRLAVREVVPELRRLYTREQGRAFMVTATAVPIKYVFLDLVRPIEPSRQPEGRS